jgi:hypothetical protein
MSADLLDELGAVLARADPVPAAVRRAAERALHRREEAAAVTLARLYPLDQVVGMGYFPDELGLPAGDA